MEASDDKSIPTVAVVGALGTQGASVIAALTCSPRTEKWQIRALTSSPDSSAAKALGTKPNITIAKCNVNDLASVHAAFAGCTYVFANTAFPGSTLLSEGPEAAEKLEREQAMNLVRAAAATKTLKHFVFSTLSDADVVSNGKWKIPHFASKQGANAFILGGYPVGGLENATEEEGWGTLRDKSTLMCVGMYGSNLRWDPYRPRKKNGASDGYVIRLPCPADAPFAMAGDEKTNVGLVVRAIFEQSEVTKGTWISCSTGQISCQQWVAALDSAAKAQGLQQSIDFEQCSMEAFEEKFGAAGTEVGVMFQYIGEMRERSFLNTSGLPEVSLRELGIDTALVSARSLFDSIGCDALLRMGDDDAPVFGTISLNE